MDPIVYTSEEVVRLWTSRYVEVLNPEYRTSYQGVPLSPAPKPDEPWVGMYVHVGGNTSAGVPSQGGVPYKLGSTAHTKAVGVVRFDLHYTGKDPRVPLQFVSVIDTCFGPAHWVVPNLWVRPAQLYDKKEDGNQVKVTVETPFTYIRNAELPSLNSLAPPLRTILGDKSSLYRGSS